MTAAGLLAAFATPLLVAVLAPTLCAALLPSRKAAAIVPALAGAAALPALLFALLSSGQPALQIDWVLFGVRMALDDTGRVFLIASATLWLCAGWYARGYLQGDRRCGAFFGFFLVAQAGNYALILAQDIASFYLGFATMTFAAYGLVVHDRTAEALRAGLVYIAMALLGEAMLIASFVIIAATAQTADLAIASAAIAHSPNRDLIVALLIAGFGVKAGVPLLHMWLPLAHPVAPTPASAVLSGAIIKAGLLGWLRFLPLGQAPIEWGGVLVVAGVIAMFGAVIAGVAQRDSKTALAYSSVSQMGYLMVAVGAGLLVPQAWPLLLPAAAMYALHHGLSKGALFLGVGVLRAQCVPRRAGMLGMLLPAAALAGAPLTSGVLAKDWLKHGLAALESEWGAWLVATLGIAAMATTLIMARVIALALREYGSATHGHDHGDSGGGEPGAGTGRDDGGAASWGLLAPWLVLLAAVAVSSWLAPAWIALEVPPAWEWAAIWSSVWPIGGGLLIAVLGATALRRRAFVIPAGDVLAPLETVLRPLARGAGNVLRLLDVRYEFSAPPALARASRVEAGISAWRTAGIAVLLLLAAFVAALALG